MPDNEHVPASLEEVISEIATILARGYMRHSNGCRIAPDSGSGAEHVAQVEESEAFTSIRLDIPGHRSLHSRVNALRLRCGWSAHGAKPMNQGGFGWMQQLVKRSRGSPG